MTEYEITIEGYDSGLTAYTIENIVKNQFPDAETVEVVETEATD